MEGIGKEMFEEWMKRLMERIDRLDCIISVLINKEAAGVKYMDGERLYDNCLLYTSPSPRDTR